MTHSTPAKRRSLAHRLAIGALTASTVMLSISACSSGGASDAPAEVDSSFAAVQQAAAERVGALTDPVTEIPLELEALTAGAADLSGKRIMVVPLAGFIFGTMVDEATAVLDRLGAEVDVCDGQAQPTEIVNCLQRAATEQVDGVITVAVSPGIAEAGYTALQKAGVPTLIGWQDAEGFEPASTSRISPFEPHGLAALTASVDYVIAHAKSAPNTLLLTVDDAASTAAISQGMVDYYQKTCVGCSSVVVETTTAQAANTGSLISSQFLADPSIDSVVAFNLDSFGTGVIDGINSAGTASVSNVTIGGQGGSIQALQLIEQGQATFVAQQSSSYVAWTLVDAFLRLTDNAAAVDYPSVIRVFDAGNIGDIVVDDEHSVGFDWFGTPVYEDSFLTSWGVK